MTRTKIALILCGILLIIGLSLCIAGPFGFFGCSSGTNETPVVKPEPKPLPPKPVVIPPPDNVILLPPVKTEPPKKENPGNDIFNPPVIVEQEHDWKWAKEQMKSGARVCRAEHNQGEYFYERDGKIYSNDISGKECDLQPNYKTIGKWIKIDDLDKFLGPYKKVIANPIVKPEVNLPDPIVVKQEVKQECETTYERPRLFRRIFRR